MLISELFLAFPPQKAGWERHEFGKQGAELDVPPGRGSPSQVGKCRKESSDDPERWPQERTSEMQVGIAEAASERQFFGRKRVRCL